MPRPLVTIALISALAALPAYAQRGGAAGHGGFAARAGGFSSHSAPAFRGTAAFSGRPAFMAAPHFGGFNTAVGVHPSAVLSNRRYGVFREDRYRRPYSRSYSLGTPYPLAGWIGSVYPGYFDPGFYDDAAAPDQPPATYSDNADGVAPPLPQADFGDQTEAQPAPVFRPAYVRPQPEPETAPETAVTLIFKDGRPSEQIHNYMLTRTTLYVQEQHLRRIPVDQIDLEATSKVNLDAGVDFSLPNVAR
jgi:hypothetical protein